MTRARRLEPVHELAHETERAAAVRLAGLEQRLSEAQQREQNLRRYRDEYQGNFKMRAGGGLNARGLREYQTFLARLGVALEAQQVTAAQLGQECGQAREQLRAALIRRKALGNVIERVQQEERAMSEQRAQRESDEHAQRPRVIR